MQEIKVDAADNQCCSSFGLPCTDLCTCKKSENEEQDLADEGHYTIFEGDNDDDESDEAEDWKVKKSFW